MDFEKEIRNALEELTCNGTFKVTKVVYDELNFGNVLVLLESNTNISIRFIRDRSDIWCEVALSGQAHEWYLLSDLFDSIGINFMSDSRDFIDQVTNTSIAIRQNIRQIDEAFDDRNIINTRKKLKYLATKRMMAMFNLKST